MRLKVVRRARASPSPGAGRNRLARNPRVPKRTLSHLREDLATEAYTHLKLALQGFGVSAAEQRRAIRRSEHLKAAPRVSGPLVRDIHGLGRLLFEWSHEADFVGGDGKPRVLDISGPGATFETLAKRSLADMTLEQAVDLACETAEVGKRPGGQIALLGSTFVKVLKSKERHLAHLIRQMDQLLSTSLHNQRMYARGRVGGRMERLSIGVIAKGEFKGFMREWRPQIYDLLLGVDSSFQRREPKTHRALQGATAVSVSVYVNEEPDLERAGAVVPPSGRAKSHRSP